MHPRPQPLAAVSALYSLGVGMAALLLFTGSSFSYRIVDTPSALVPGVSAQGPLQAAFLLLIGSAGLAAALAGRREGAGIGHQGLVLAFLLGMTLVVLADNVFTLILAWETMSTAPGLILVTEERASARRAGILYLLYSHLAAMAILGGLLVWGDGLSADFGTLAARPLPPSAAVFIWVGCLAKSGVMPFHSWLPEAHPEAPSHVSALMSGVMVAIPTYLLLRLLADTRLDAAIATPVMLAGSVTAALGALHALHARNLKRLLALTTVAHMGALAALVAVALRLPASSTLRAPIFAAAIVYALSHGWSKAALFLVAGEIHHATGELDLERLGGLARHTGALSVVAMLAAFGLSGLPPTSGVSAEIGLLTSFFAALRNLSPFDGVVVLGALFLLAIGAGAGVAAMGKAVFGTFFGPRRSDTVPHVAAGAVVAPGILLVGILGIGVAPGLLWSRLLPGTGLGTVQTPIGDVSTTPVIAVGLVVATVLLIGTRAAFARPEPADPWNCGAAPPTPRQTYTPHGLVMPYRILFAEILRPRSDLRIQDAPIVPFAPAKGQYEDSSPRFVDPWAHEPLTRAVLFATERLRRLHRGPVQAYLVVALLALVFLLFVLGSIP